MVHFICKGECGGESSEMKKCDDKNCSLYDSYLTECDCTDGKHHDKKDK